MIPFIFTLALSCPLPKMENRTKFPWNDHDKSVFNKATKRCEQIYTNSPCVKLFRKWGERDFSVICGKKE